MKNSQKISLVILILIAVLIQNASAEEHIDPFIYIDGITSLYVTQEGDLYMSGRLGEMGIEGLPDKSYQYVKIMSGVKQAKTSHSLIAILKVDGTLWTCMKSNIEYLHPNRPKTLAKEPIKIADNVSDFEVKNDNLYMIKNDSSLWVLGENSSNDLLLMKQATFNEPTKIMEGVKQVSSFSSDTVSYVLKTDGSVWSIGAYSPYQPIEEWSSEPYFIAENIKKIRAGQDKIYMIDENDVLFRWSAIRTYYSDTNESTFGVLDELMPNVYDVFEYPDDEDRLDDCILIHSKDGKIIVGKKLGTKFGETKVIYKGIKKIHVYDCNRIMIDSNDQLYTLGKNNQGVLGFSNNTSLDISSPKKVSEGIIDVDLDRNYILREDGKLLFWDKDNSENYTFIETFGDKLDNITYSKKNGSLIKFAGETKLYAFFDNTISDTVIESKSPYKYVLYEFDEAIDDFYIKHPKVGEPYLIKDGKLMDKNNDQILFTEYSNHLNKDIKLIDFKNRRTYFLNTNGDFYTWFNVSAYSTENGLKPQLIAENVASFQIGYNDNIFVLKNDGSLYVKPNPQYWYHELDSELQIIKITEGVKQHDGLIVVKDNGDVENFHQALYKYSNTKNPDVFNSPVKEFSNAKFISVLDTTRAAITEDGELYCWSTYHDPENVDQFFGVSRYSTSELHLIRSLPGLADITTLLNSPDQDSNNHHTNNIPNDLTPNTSSNIDDVLKDITSDHPNYVAMNYFYRNGVVNGYPDLTIKSEADITRAEVAAIITKSLALKSTNKSKTFNDVDNHWSKKYALITGSNGIFNGYNDGSFGVDKNITYAEVMVVITNLTGGLTENLQLDSEELTDIKWYSLYPYDLLHKGIINDDEMHSLLDMAVENSSRAYMMEILYRALINNLIDFN
ncbi:S-layer homology domain-containing protein [Acidaminobacter sp. JC074]|uniref:S-layer homology domain-containing protein n=1 Tax=Acidaminobacter sp. JC074 TaxID=2530199 RepID=UPI001F0FF3B5|nr:S-layer homology domain-containing protein [Acidaminobacter sp. JC074]MCH4890667.1 S-layer homology domain-containing protein [Acidaminobacter sp. JC074]